MCASNCELLPAQLWDILSYSVDLDGLAATSSKYTLTVDLHYPKCLQCQHPFLL